MACVRRAPSPPLPPSRPPCVLELRAPPRLSPYASQGSAPPLESSGVVHPSPRGAALAALSAGRVRRCTAPQAARSLAHGAEDHSPLGQGRTTLAPGTGSRPRPFPRVVVAQHGSVARLRGAAGPQPPARMRAVLTPEPSAPRTWLAVAQVSRETAPRHRGPRAASLALGRVPPGPAGPPLRPGRQSACGRHPSFPSRGPGQGAPREDPSGACRRAPAGPAQECRSAPRP
jgi:hypothetical protein